MDGWQIGGGAAFGAVVGWTTYFILRRAQPKALSDITTFIGAIGGAAVTGLFDSKGQAFAGYAIGLLIGFFSYYIAFLVIVGKHAMRESLIASRDGEKPPPAMMPETGVSGVDWGADRRQKT